MNFQQLLPADFAEFASSREQIRTLVQVIGRLKHLADSSVERTHAYARDSEDFGEQLKALGAINMYPTTGGHWMHMQKGFNTLSRFVYYII